MTVTNGHSFQFSTSECNFESEEMQAAEPFDAFDMWLRCKSEETKVHSEPLNAVALADSNKLSEKILEFWTQSRESDLQCERYKCPPQFFFFLMEFKWCSWAATYLDVKVSLFSDQMV